MEQDSERAGGACHCGAVRFRVRLQDGLREPRRCDCSFCRMRGAVVVSARVEDFAITEGHDLLTEYRFNTGVARHFFCSRCGIYTHHRRRSDPDQYGVNVACLDGVSPFDFDEVPVADGVNHPADGVNHPADGVNHPADGVNHPADGVNHPADGAGSGVVGHLRFVRRR